MFFVLHLGILPYKQVPSGIQLTWRTSFTRHALAGWRACSYISAATLSRVVLGESCAGGLIGMEQCMKHQSTGKAALQGSLWCCVPSQSLYQAVLFVPVLYWKSLFCGNPPASALHLYPAFVYSPLSEIRFSQLPCSFLLLPWLHSR